jgi:hypothetical protein
MSLTEIHVTTGLPDTQAVKSDSHPADDAFAAFYQ